MKTNENQDRSKILLHIYSKSHSDDMWMIYSAQTLICRVSWKFLSQTNIKVKVSMIMMSKIKKIIKNITHM